MGCNRSGVKMTKEHFFPQWLIERAGTDKTAIKWINGIRIPARAATVPLCARCNKHLGDELEGPVARIFSDLESGRGLSDREAELLVRWLWKFEGLAWKLVNPRGTYTTKYTLVQRVLQPIDEIRGSLILAIGMINKIDPTFGDSPMGIDSFNRLNAIFVAGVFLNVALMVLLEDFASLVPPEFSQYHFMSKPDALSDAKLFYPKVGFSDDTEAIVKTALAARILSDVHDKLGVRLSVRL
jgi:hypothetical protein